jgi:NAD(P)-dependent dehydrogenase (short-subunit alcohol dehydrogenase family)
VRSAGGRALGRRRRHHHLAGAQGIVDAAVAAFGEVQVLVNNAGVLRDRMFLSLTEDDWDTVMRVHLRGHFCLANVLGRRWRDAKKAGTPVDTRASSTPVRAPGCRARSGRATTPRPRPASPALTLVQAAELARYGITVNCLAPAARTSMTEGAMPDLVKKPESRLRRLGPAERGRIVVWLGSPLSASRDRPLLRGQGRRAVGGRRLAHGRRSSTRARAGSRRSSARWCERLIEEGRSRRRRSTAPERM